MPQPRPTEILYDVSLKNCRNTNKQHSFWRLTVNSFFTNYDKPAFAALRLANGPSELEGRLEAGLHGQLQSVCGYGFDDKAANVACKSRGFR